jgi:quercetin dioxygenase-like cupin family protein
MKGHHESKEIRIHRLSGDPRSIRRHRPCSTTFPDDRVCARGTVGHLDANNSGVEVERKGSADHVVASITFPPGSSIPWHSHPGVVLVTVGSGKLQVIHEDCERQVFEAGDSFYEEGDVHFARNRGNVDTVIYATWIIPTKTPADGLTVPADAPEDCNVQ